MAKLCAVSSFSWGINRPTAAEESNTNIILFTLGSSKVVVFTYMSTCNAIEFLEKNMLYYNLFGIFCLFVRKQTVQVKFLLTIVNLDVGFNAYLVIRIFEK